VTSLVTGANRGLGEEVAIQLGRLGHHVILCARQEESVGRVAGVVRESGGEALTLQLDVTQEGSVARAVATVSERLGKLDVLVNNAGGYWEPSETATGVDIDKVRAAIDLNLLGSWRVTQAFLPLLRRSQHPRIVNVSSGAGNLTEMGAGNPGYKVSKAGMNALTRMLAAELKIDNVLVNSVCPGWVATRMGGAGGRPVEDGAAGIVWAATLEDSGPSGGFFRDGKPIPW